jgi:hypothetical protein
MPEHYIVKIESFEGNDTYLNCGDDNQDWLFCVIAVDEDGSAEIVDNAYRSLGEAAEAWPHAANARRRVV